MAKIFFSIISMLIIQGSLCAEPSVKYVKLNDTSNFELDTVNIPKGAISAIKYSIAMLDSVVSSTIPIRISIKFSNTSRADVLATGVAGSYEYGFCDLADPNFTYPVSLAEKLAGKNINGDKPDVSVIVNKNINWHYAIDTVGLAGKFDFITLLTHEIVHGLGFQSLLSVYSGKVDTSRIVSIFDSFLADKAGRKLFPHYFKKGSSAVYSFITSDSLFFISPHFNSAHRDSLLLLYAPKNYASGNSIHHFALPAKQVKSELLMRPGFRAGEYQRRIDLPTKCVLRDIGWGRALIAHSKPYDIDTLESSQVLRFATDRTLENFSVAYSFDGFINSKTVVPENNDGAYSVAIPALEFNHTVSYRTQFQDPTIGQVNMPCDTCALSYVVGIDVEAPRLSNLNIPSIYVNASEIVIRGKVADNSGRNELKILLYEMRDSAYIIRNDSVLYTKSKTLVPSLTIVHDTLENGVFEFKYSGMNAREKDKLLFYFTARDLSQKSNIATVFTEKTVMTLGEIRYTYANDFNSASGDFALDGFTISTNPGFSSGSLHTAHPYIAPNVDQDTLLTYAYLTPRIILDDVHHYMTFDEIVLVEPAEHGKMFGEFGYWDFVSVEGSKDNGDTWHIFGKVGYDASADETWHLSFLSKTAKVGRNLNSLYVPSEDLYRPRKINLIENKYLKKQDTVMIRFKLTSDAFSTGWGWSIDNLSIQAGANSQAQRNGYEILAYPNPAESVLNVPDAFDKMPFQIYSVMGILVSEGLVANGIVDVANIPNGLYCLIIKMGDEIYSHHFVKQ